jgi:dihydroflavonol-4-reductase
LGLTEDESFIDETTQWKSKKSNSSYSFGKYYSELHVWRGFSEGMTGIVVSPSIIIGPVDGFTGISPMIYMVKRGLKYYPSGSNGFVDVRDVVDSMIKLTLHTEITNERFIVNAENLSFKELLVKISNAVNKQPPNQEATLFKLKVKYFIEDILRTLKIRKSKVSLELIHLISKNYSYSNQKIQTALSINFRSVEESIKDNLESQNLFNSLKE